MKKHALKIVVWQEGSQFVAQCLNVDVSSFGNTQKEALANIKEALELFLEGSNIENIPEVQKPTVITQQLSNA